MARQRSMMRAGGSLANRARPSAAPARAAARDCAQATRPSLDHFAAEGAARCRGLIDRGLEKSGVEVRPGGGGG